ncbi:MAG: hypothetical protein KAU50_04020, partial [Candidatus Marinimicrobia bacterium]|nr:hypothetical protein [Candidatus Neomarinimicrobiota bacterium]
MNQRYYAGLLLLLILIVSAELRAGAPKNYLSNLSATRGSPLYTTYAAAMERSEFTLDEGYHLTFYDSARGVDFTTDTGGDWCLAFRQGNKIVYRLNELHKEPVISVSYPDMVSYYYYPFENILVEVTFLVHSSRLAIQDIKVANLGEEKTTIQVIPFLQNNYRTYDRIDFQPARNAVLFSHEELPDGWVLEHEVPYVDHVRNVFMVSKTIDNLTCYRSYGGEKIEIPKAVRLEAESQFYLWGTVTGSDGERVRQLPPQARLVACLNDDYSQLITENSPVWGRTDPGISRYGVYGMELGALGTLAEGSTGTVRYYSEVTGEEGTVQIDFTEEQRGK